MDESDYFLLIDGHALIYRAYHAFPGMTDPAGRLVNAVYGFSRILLASIRDFDPKYIAVAFDHPKPTLRQQDFADYKAHRAKMPDDLIPQIELIKEVVEALNIPQFEVSGYEADDLIGTIAVQIGKHPDVTLVPVTGDKDLLQLVTEQVEVFIPARGKFGKDILYTPNKVEEKMGVRPDQIIELKALMGDSSDNIPGVKGVGAKTAVKLIQRFGKLEALYERVGDLELSQGGIKDDLLKGSLLEKLVRDKDQAYLSRNLATIMRNAPINLDLPACRVVQYNKEAVSELFVEDLNFKSLIDLLPDDEFEVGVQSALF